MDKYTSLESGDKRTPDCESQADQIELDAHYAIAEECAINDPRCQFVVYWQEGDTPGGHWRVYRACRPERFVLKDHWGNGQAQWLYNPAGKNPVFVAGHIGITW